jgi:hypothetical protein
LKTRVTTYPMRILSSVILIVLLASYCVYDGNSLMEIAYDDGRPESTSSLDIGMHLAVRFSLPLGTPEARFMAAKIYKAGRSGVEMKVHVLASNGLTELTAPFIFNLSSDSAWNTADLSTRSILVSESFYITVEYLKYYDPLIGRDTTDPKGRSYYGRPGSWSPVENGENIMIRATVGPLTANSTSATVTPPIERRSGGLAPYFFLACIVALTLTALAAKKAHGSSQSYSYQLGQDSRQELQEDTSLSGPCSLVGDGRRITGRGLC